MTDPTRNERQRRWYWSHREAKITESRRRYYEAKAAGLCVACYTAPAIQGLVRCQECYEKHTARRLRKSLTA